MKGEGLLNTAVETVEKKYSTARWLLTPNWPDTVTKQQGLLNTAVETVGKKYSTARWLLTPDWPDTITK